ncbi:MAG: hypothetical protein ACREUG_04740 [Steroidobacteraceae bacterium]
MSAGDKPIQADIAPRKRPAYDPNNLDPIDAEARKLDDTSEGFDWDEIIASTQDDEEAGRFAFDSRNYATEEQVTAALERHFDEMLERVMRRVRRETADGSLLDTAGK